MPESPIPLERLAQIFFFVEYVGIFVGAIGGAVGTIRDSRYKYDIVGVFGLGMVSALGGGILRDIIVQQGPPLAFRYPSYLLTAMAGCLVALFFERWIAPRTQRVLNVIEAAALGLFAVAGCTRALVAGFGPLAALLVGVITAVGGGSLRDVLGGRTPRIFEGGELFTIPVTLGSAVFLAAEYLRLPRELSTLLGAATCFALRMLAVRYKWHTRPVRGD